ncbi:MAG TPA: hypothetical protein VJ144_05705, partial [Candidatus Polarisedimenticolia bacterium]|nr:hypothetical protein [Candidatus Polarisedimenticolia bacterium]
GLENPLAHLLLALYLQAYLRGDRPRRLGFLAALIGVTRMDLLLLLLPAVASACRGPFGAIGTGPTGAAERPFVERTRRLGPPLRAAAVGFLPFLIWEIFALVYYGFLFPNPAYAKLATGLPRLELIGRGLEYLLNSACSDPLTLAAIACGIGAALAARRRRDLAVGLGIASYLVYIVLIGGDFMSGRFLAAPLLAAVILCARASLRPKIAWAVACGVGLAFALLPAYTPEWIALRLGARHRFAHGVHPAIDENGIADERAVYYDDSSLARAPRAGPWPNPGSAQQAAAIRADWVANTWLSNLQGFGLVDPDEASPTGALRTTSGVPLAPVVARSSIGFLGYYCGPGIHILDFQALGDPLLARLPALRRDPMLPVLIPRLAGKKYRIGHFVRRIPAGYFETLVTGENRIRDPRLAAYYDRLSLITRGPIWDARRLLEIIKMNLGIGDRPAPSPVRNPG